MQTPSRRANKKRSYHAAQKFIADLKNKPCELCRVQYKPWQMHFDHLDHRTKKSDLAHCRTIASAVREMKKCRLLCANCHADVTYKNRHIYQERGYVQMDDQQREFWS